MATFFQYISWPFVYLFSKIFFRVSITSAEDISKLKGPLIIVSNHIAPYDSFFLRLIFGRHTQLLPIRFMGSGYFHDPFLRFLHKIGVVSLVYRLFGTFEIPKEGTFEEKLMPAKKILAAGGTVYLFPEGRMSWSSIQPFKKGAAALAIDTGVPILPIALSPEDSKRYKKVLAIKVGEKIIFTKEIGILEGTESIYRSIKELSEEKVIATTNILYADSIHPHTVKSL